MPPPRRSISNKSHKIVKPLKFPKNYIEKYCNYQFFESLVFDPRRIALTAVIFIIAEVFVNLMVIQRVAYTEIDWKAYMQEVEGVVNGTFDYSQLKGDTGPLVYPAGFVYIFTILYYITSYGTNIRLAQYIFACLYISTLVLVIRLYSKSKKVPPYILFFLCCTSYRVHSIFILRLFNDPVAMLLLYASLNLFLDGKWSWGSFVFSLAVSVKMNILLFAPALLLAYLTSLGVKKTIFQLSICAVTQLILGLPFLLTNPMAYIAGAFNLGRIFLYEWTVNWRFIPEDIFVSQPFHLAMLAIHILLLLCCSPSWLTYFRSFANIKMVEKDVKPHLSKKEKSQFNTSSTSQLFLTPLFVCNFIGIACSRSLHYQFYVWYFHTLPYILWCTPFTVIARLSLLGVIELCWNTFPSTTLSSIALLCSHLIILVGIIQGQRNVSKASKEILKNN